MKKKIKLFALGAVVVTILLGVAAGIKIRQMGSMPVEQKTSAGLPVEIITAEKTSLTQEISYVGTVEPCEEVDLSPKISSKILSISGREGDVLKKGQVAISLENNELEGKVRTLEKRVQTAKINIDYWDSQLKRMEYLYKEGALSEQEYEKAVFSRDSALSGYEEANAALSEARVAQQNSVITSPLTGTVTTVLSYPGDLAVPGKPILKVSDLSGIKIKVKVVEADLVRLKTGTPVKLMTGLDASSYRASISGIYPSLDRTSRTGTVEIDVPEDMLKNNNLKPGMSINTYFILGEKQNALVVPKQTVESNGSTNYVFTVKDGKAAKTVVKTGLSNDEYIEITDGLEAGQPVISAGIGEVTDGTNLYVNKERIR